MLEETYKIFSKSIFLDDGSMILGLVMITIVLMMLLKIIARGDGFLRKFKDAMHWNGFIRITLLVYLPLVCYSLI